MAEGVADKRSVIKNLQKIQITNDAKYQAKKEAD
jgi:hypothetical protein